MLIYDAFIKLCAQVNKTPSAVALELGLEKSTVTRWKKGGGASDITKLKLAEYFGITKEDFLKLCSLDQLSGSSLKVSNLDTTPPQDDLKREFDRLFEKLPPDKKEFVLAAMRGMIEK